MDNFFCGFVAGLLLFLFPTINGIYARDAIAKCEEKLPRNIECRITAEPIPETEGE